MHKDKTIVKDTAMRCRIYFLFIFLSAYVCLAQTIVTGNQWGTWSLSKSPYLIGSECIVPVGKVLTIEPGVKVILAYDAAIKVYGKIKAIGTAPNPIIFTSPNDTTYWKHIYVEYTKNDTSVFDYCSFSYANRAIWMKIAFEYRDQMTVIISNCTFTNCLNEAILGESFGETHNSVGGMYANDPSLNPFITSCLFNGLKYGCIFSIYGEDWYSAPDSYGKASPIVRNNIFKDISVYAIGFLPGSMGGNSYPKVCNNNFIQCNEAIYIKDPFQGEIKNNIFFSNQVAIHQIGTGTKNVAYNCFFEKATNNFIGFPDSYGRVVFYNYNNNACDISFNIFENPQFVDSLYFFVNPGSPCKHAGDPNLFVNADGTPPDVGVLEFALAGVSDVLGPICQLISCEPNPTQGADTVSVKVMITDEGNGNNPIIDSEYSINSLASPGNGFKMLPLDKNYDSSREIVQAAIPVNHLATGNQYTIFIRGKDAAGNWSQVLEVSIYITSAPKQANITLADTAAAPGTLVKLAIRIDDVSGLAALQGRLRFDPALLEATKIETSALTSEFSLADSLLPGKAAFSLARATGLSAGGGDLLYITLLVKSGAQAGDTCSLALENMHLFDEASAAISHTVRQGLFTVNIPGGEAGFYIQPDTLIVAAGQSINLQAFLRAADGQVTAAASDWTLEPLAEIGKTRIVGALSGSSGTQVTLQTKRIGDGRIIARSGGHTDTAWVCVKGLAGDVTADSMIMANDPGQILRAAISLPLAPLPPGHLTLTLYERLAADYNADGVVNVDDAKLVLDKSLDHILKRTGMPGSGPALAGISAVQINGNDLLYPVTMQLRGDIAAARITLSYDAAQMTLIGVAPAVTGGQCLRNEVKPGRVLIAAIHPQQMVDANQQLFLLQFRGRRNDLPAPPVIDRIELFDQQCQPVDVSLTASETIIGAMLGAFQLQQNYPNPFNPVTTISYGLQRDAHVRLDVYNANGQRVCTLVEGEKSAGLWQATWDGRNAAGEHLGSGIYFCRLQIDRGSFVETRKMVLMR